MDTAYEKYGFYTVDIELETEKKPGLHTKPRVPHKTQ